MGILNLVYCYLFLLISLAVIQAIYIEMAFFVQSPLESWHLLKADRVFISFMFKSVNLSILQKTINKTSKSPHAFLTCTYLAKRLRELSSTKTGSYPHEFLCRTDCSACADYQPCISLLYFESLGYPSKLSKNVYL